MEESLGQNKKREYAQFLEGGSMPSNQSTESALVSPEPDRLCARCRAIDLKAIFQKIRLERGSFIIDLKASVGELKASDFDMCQLFGSISPWTSVRTAQQEANDAISTRSLPTEFLQDFSCLRCAISMIQLSWASSAFLLTSITMLLVAFMNFP
jgi:hypothetical protein